MLLQSMCAFYSPHRWQGWGHIAPENTSAFPAPEAWFNLFVAKKWPRRATKKSGWFTGMIPATNTSSTHVLIFSQIFLHYIPWNKQRGEVPLLRYKDNGISSMEWSDHFLSMMAVSAENFQDLPIRLSQRSI